MSQKRLVESEDSLTRTRERLIMLLQSSQSFASTTPSSTELLSLPKPASRMSHLHRAIIARGKTAQLEQGFLGESTPHSDLQGHTPQTAGTSWFPTSWYPWLGFPYHTTMIYSQSFGLFHIGENESLPLHST